MFNTIVPLIGLRIDDDRIIAFLEQHGFKYPKKTNISNKSSDDSYWIQNKKLGIDLLFKIEHHLEQYPLIPADKKGIFVPVLSNVRWFNNKSKTEFPHNLDFNHDFDAIKAKLGEPTYKSSDITPTWLNDDGTESFYRWNITINADKCIYWGLQFDDDQTIRDIALGLFYRNPLFHLYYEKYYETFDSFMKQKDFYNTAYLMLLQWAIENDLVRTNENTAPVAAAIKAGKAPITEWIRAINKGAIVEEDFSGQQRFIRQYVNNLTGKDILYTRDVAFLFLPTDELKQNYFSKETTAELNKLEFNSDNYAKVKALIDRRLEEYAKH